MVDRCWSVLNRNCLQRRINASRVFLRSLGLCAEGYVCSTRSTYNFLLKFRTIKLWRMLRNGLVWMSSYLYRSPNHVAASQENFHLFQQFKHSQKARHRLIRVPRLSLDVCDLLLLALFTLQHLAHADPLMCRIRPRHSIYVYILYNSFFPDMAP